MRRPRRWITPEVGYTKRRHQWTEADILEKLQEWVDLYGEPPTATDWHPGDARRCAQISATRSLWWLQRARRFEEGEWPWTGSVHKRFGSWSNALRAAGYTPRRVRESPTRGEQIDSAALEDLVAQLDSTRDADSLRMVLYTIAEKAIGWAESIEREEP